MRLLKSGVVLLGVLVYSDSFASTEDIEKGRDFFLNRCVACHAFACNKDGSDSGPKLGGLFGRKAASVPDYDGYSEGLKNSGIVWTAASLDAYFTDPTAVEPENTMAYDGLIEDSEQRRQLIAFLKTEDPSVNLCF